MRYEVSAMPTFLFFRNREKVHQVLNFCIFVPQNFNMRFMWLLILTRCVVLMKQLWSQASFSILARMLSQQRQLVPPVKYLFLDRWVPWVTYPMHAQGLVSSVVIVVSINISSWDLCSWATCKYNESIEFGEKWLQYAVHVCFSWPHPLTLKYMYSNHILLHVCDH